MEHRFSQLISFTEEMATFAKENQTRIHRTTKADGSFVTETDLAINDAMIRKIGELYPEANVVTEETDQTGFNPEAPLTFILDPIDGTTAYSRGMPNWAISIGIIDKSRKPIGAIVSLPRFGCASESSLFVREPGSDIVYLNGKEHKIDMEGRNEIHDMITGDRTWKIIEFPKDFRCKMRSMCSSVLDMLSLILFRDFGAAINDHGCYVWDVAGTDGILSAYGIVTTMSDGNGNMYSDKYLVDRKPYELPVYAATPGALAFMYKNFKVKI